MGKILVTGATGFIGKHLLQHLLSHHSDVRILVRNSTPAIRSDHLEIVKGNLTDAQSLQGICEDIDTVFHLAGYAHAWAENNANFAKTHHTTNFLGTQNLLNEAIRANVKKFIFISSVKAVADSQTCIDENWSALPHSPYGMAKREAERLVLAAAQKNMHVCVLRLPLVFGPHWKGNLDSMLRAIDRGLFPALPETHNRRSLVSVEDVCRAALTVAEHPNAHGKVYYVTDRVDYSSRKIYDLMRQSLGKQQAKWSIPLWVFKSLAFAGDYGSKILKRRMPFNTEALSKLFGSACYSSQNIMNDTGFQPIHTLESMLPDIIAAYKNQ